MPLGLSGGLPFGFGGGFAFGFFHRLPLGLSGGLPFRFLSGLPFGFLNGLALGLFRGFAFRFLSGLTFRLNRSLPLSLFSGFTFRRFRRLAAFLFFALAPKLRLMTRFCFPFSPRYFGLPFRFLALAATLFLGLPLHLCPDRRLIHEHGRNRLSLLRFRMRRARQIQIEQQKNADRSMQGNGNHRCHNILIGRPAPGVHEPRLPAVWRRIRRGAG